MIQLLAGALALGLLAAAWSAGFFWAWSFTVMPGFAAAAPEAAIAAMRAGVAFASGWPETGSTTGCTSAPMRASEAFSADQWIGAKAVPRYCPTLRRTRSTALP